MEYNFDMYKLGERLAELRREKGVSIKQLGNAIDVSDASICRWENGLNDIKGKDLCKLAEFFDVTTDYLLGRED